MTTNTVPDTASALRQAAAAAGLDAPEVLPGHDTQGAPTIRLQLERGLAVQVSDAFAPSAAPLRAGLAAYFEAVRARLGNPDPELYVTAAGIPLRLTGFEWPFHRSKSGADTYLVHGLARLADAADSPLHAKLSASMTVTFAEIVDSPEQPFCEDFVYNAIRKTFDYGQLELVKSGNRQPVPVTTRYYSRWGKHFQFTDSTPESRQDFLALKAFWLSGIHGGSAQGEYAPVWLTDPRDAQYLNTTPAELAKDVQALAQAGYVAPAAEGFAAATAALLARETQYRAQLADALNALKPAFNEQMRAGLTNM